MNISLAIDMHSPNKIGPGSSKFLICFMTVVTLATMFVMCSSRNRHPGSTIGLEKYPNVRDLYVFAEVQRKIHNLPALGVGIIRDGKIMGLGMAGERKIGSGDWTTIDDFFDFASCMKSMTATVAAMLVEKKRLNWHSTLGDLFPELRNIMQPDYQGVTLEMLLSHRSGLDSWMGDTETWTAWYEKYGTKSPTEQRYLFTRKVLQDKPLYPPGSAHHYCNDGYLVVASVIEKITGTPWEEYIQQQLFFPLKLDNTYAGMPDVGRREKIAWGHEDGMFRTVDAISPEDELAHGNPPFGSGSGKLMSTIPNMLRYLDFHMRGQKGEYPFLLTPASFSRLHAPVVGQTYALGWNVDIIYDQAGSMVERSIFHGGYNGRSRANIWFSPDSGYGTVIVYNYAAGKSIDAYQEIFYSLLRKFDVIP